MAMRTPDRGPSSRGASQNVSATSRSMGLNSSGHKQSAMRTPDQSRPFRDTPQTPRNRNIGVKSIGYKKTPDTTPRPCAGNGSAQERTLDIVSSGPKRQKTQEGSTAPPRAQCLHAKLSQAKTIQTSPQQAAVVDATIAVSSPLDSKIDGGDSNRGASASGSDYSPNESTEESEDSEPESSLHQVMPKSTYPSLKYLGISILESKTDSFWKLLASSTNQALKTMHHNVFVGEHMEDLISGETEPSETYVDALKKFVELFQCRIIVARVPDIEDKSKVDQFLLINEQQRVTTLTSPIMWKQMVGNSSVSTLLIVLDKEGVKTLHQPMSANPRLRFGVANSPLGCRLWVNQEVILQIFSSFRFFEPTTMVRWKGFPDNFPEYQWRMGAALALLCDDRFTEQRFTEQHLVEAEKLYRSICEQGQYCISNAKNVDNRLEAHFVFHSLFGKKKITCGTLANAAVELLKKNVKRVQLELNANGVLPLEQAKAFLPGSRLAEELVKAIAAEASIPYTNMFTCYSRSGELIAANRNRAVVVRYIAVMYGCAWMTVVPRKLPIDVQNEMKSTIKFVKGESGFRVRTITMRKVLWIDALTRQDLFEKIWGQFDEAWSNHLEVRQPVVKNEYEVAPPPLPESEIRLMENRLRLFSHSRSHEFTARWSDGSQTASFPTERELYQHVWNKCHYQWQQRVLCHQYA